ncbi:uncharacterized protein LOC141913398 isoform X2 [Tubulanus polymorphus]|uniref:uncharacterized protein LOC141913398 isoform X2 n=1 Tax=Tubulanus polymorphus TaxID=672921 RepID=UPI003DA69A02
MSGGEEQIECPLCMEPLEMDDLSFYPCTCGYQICRFCWHRLRTYENGLCPACRKLYPENPAEFKPLTDDELQRIKKERRQKDHQRKQKAAENRKHLANVRVVQKNLVFVVGLSPRLADPEVLKRHEYFGKFGKIHKVVINQSTTYAGSQSNGPSAGAYVTYLKAEDALKAIQNVNNVYVDSRTLKASLGTTKYCSHFLKGTQCPKLDCMYLHELGEEAASFTKEEMQQGKHQDYEQRLYEQYMNSQNTAHHGTTTTSKTATHPATTVSTSSSSSVTAAAAAPVSTSSSSPPSSSSSAVTTTSSNSTNQQLNTTRKKTISPTTALSPHPLSAPGTSSLAPQQNTTANKSERLTNGNKPPSPPQKLLLDTENNQQKAPGANINKHRTQHQQQQQQLVIQPDNNANSNRSSDRSHMNNSDSSNNVVTHNPLPTNIGANTKNVLIDSNPENSLSLFSGSGFPSMRVMKPVAPPVQPAHNPPTESIPTTEIADTIPVSSSTDWQAAFGFKSAAVEHHDDDLGFDPWDESAKGLADLIEREQGQQQNLRSINHHHQQQHHHLSPHSLHHQQQQSSQQQILQQQQQQSVPPGFAPSHINPYLPNSKSGGYQLPTRSKILGLMSSTSSHPPGFNSVNNASFINSSNCTSSSSSSYTNMISDCSGNAPQQNEDIFTKNWQEGLKALFPNVNISFGTPNYHQGSAGVNRPTPGNHRQQQQQQLPPPRHHLQHHNIQNKSWPSQCRSSSAVDWMSQDPAIVTSGGITEHAQNLTTTTDEQPPHWMKSLQQLTEIDTNPNHRLPFVQSFPFRGRGGWTQNPPPGFQTQMRPPTQLTEPHTIAEGLQ